MENNTGYVITRANCSLVSYISGRPLSTIIVNIGWVAMYSERWMPRWRLMPRNVAEREQGFRLVDSPLNGEATRSIDEIIKARSELNSKYSQQLEVLNAEYTQKLQALNDEYERAKIF